MKNPHFSRASLVAALGAATTLSGAPPPAAASMLDQSSGPLDGIINNSLEWQQQVTDGIDGVLAGVVIYGFDYNPGSHVNSMVTVRIGLGSGFVSGPYVLTAPAYLSEYSSGTFIDTSVADIHLKPGDQFVIDVSGGGDYSNLAFSNSVYTGGDLFLNAHGQVIDETQAAPADPYQISPRSLAFQTYVNPVPLPATNWLMLSGLGCLAALTRIRKPLSGASPRTA